MAADGLASVHIAINSPGTVTWHIELEQDNLALTSGTEYRVHLGTGRLAANHHRNFTRRRAELPELWSLRANCHRHQRASIPPRSSPPPRPTTDAWNSGSETSRGMCGSTTTALAQSLGLPPDFTGGVVLVLGRQRHRRLTLESGFQRFTGKHRSIYQYIGDDAHAGFSATVRGSPSTTTPVPMVRCFYSRSSLELQRPLLSLLWQGAAISWIQAAARPSGISTLPLDGQYSIQVWLPAAPGAANWTKSALYEIVAGENVVSDIGHHRPEYRQSGDARHQIATVEPQDGGRTYFASPQRRIRLADCRCGLPRIGSPVQRRLSRAAGDARRVRRHPPATPAAAARAYLADQRCVQCSQLPASDLIRRIRFDCGTRIRCVLPCLDVIRFFSQQIPPVELDGMGITINGKPAFVEYVSPTQVNAIAPDDATIGNVQVQVTTPQGASYSAIVLKQALSPAFFTYQSVTTTYVAAIHLDGTLVGPALHIILPLAVPGEVIELYGTGSG